jgi:hypothetical protein
MFYASGVENDECDQYLYSSSDENAGSYPLVVFFKERIANAINLMCSE